MLPWVPDPDFLGSEVMQVLDPDLLSNETMGIPDPDLLGNGIMGIPDPDFLGSGIMGVPESWVPRLWDYRSMSPCSGSFMILFITFVTWFSLDFPDLLLDIQMSFF